MTSAVKVRHLYRTTFLIALATAAVIFVPAIIWDQGYFLFLGDFNSQQVPFYMNCHDAIRNGEWAWNWYTDLGCNFIGSYTFYLLGSPFFWLTIPFPSAAVPYLMGPLLILKFACAALFSCMYLRRYVKNENFALLGGLLYAFSGFSIYNIFFNHFHEPLIFFPLMLMALDDLVQKNRRGEFVLAVFLNAMISYFFFFGEVVFIVLYYIVRVASGSYKTNVKGFFTVLLEAVIGFLMSGILMLPSVMCVWQNSRVHRSLTGFSLWLYSSKERIPAILNSFLFPPELPSKQVFLPDAGTKWTSLSAYLPLVSVSGALTFMGSRRKDWLTSFLMLLFIMALVPGLNALYVALNTAYYARWFYMFTLMLVLATVRCFDRGMQERLERVTWRVLVVTLLIVLILGLTPQYKDGKLDRIGLYDEEYWPCFVVIGAVAVASLLVFTQIIPKLRKNAKLFARNCVIAVCIISMLYGNFFIFWGKAHSYDTKNYIIPDCIQGEEKITIPDKEEVIRIDADDAMINLGMFWKISCMRAFHSIVPGSIMDFYKYIGEKRDVSSKIPESQYAVRGLLSVEYYFDRIGLSTDFGDPNENDPLMPGFSYYDDMAGFHVWKNDYYIPMGFTYDEYVSRSEEDQLSDSNKAAAMLHAVCLEDEDVAKYADVLTHSDMMSSGYTYNTKTYFADCEARRAQTVDNLTRTKTGVTCTSSFSEDRFVFFSIPYDSGWSLYIDGVETELVKANVGFMGFKVPAGQHDIELVYRTPGLKAGMLISLGALILFVLYMIVCKKRGMNRVNVVAGSAKESHGQKEEASPQEPAAEPEVPDEPQVPDAPEMPGESEVPDEPQMPDEPEMPDEPKEPEKPEGPHEPD